MDPTANRRRADKHVKLTEGGIAYADLVLGALCGACILCQEWRELDKRGVPEADMKNIM